MGAAVGVISEVTGIGASLYAMLDTLTERNLIAAEGEAKSRSRYYLLTKLGREVLGAMTND
jgi:DNA-binding PadR family transcriptional regulator